MPANKKDLAVVEQENNKCPIFHPRELNAEVFQQFKTAYYNYVINKDILDNNQSIKVMTALRGYQWEAWVLVLCNALKILSLQQFLDHFKDFIPSTWGNDVQIQLNQMTQK